MRRTKMASPTATLDSSCKKDELFMLQGIVKYQDETKSISYISDWDAFYESTNHLKTVELRMLFSLVEAKFIKGQLRSKVRKLQERFTHGEGPFFVESGDNEIYKLAMVIWGKPGSNMNTNVTCMEQDQINDDVEQEEVAIGQQEKKKKVGDEDFCVLHDAFEAIMFPTFGEVHQKLLLQNLKNLEAKKGKELVEEWKALVVEDIKFNIKKLTYYAKLTEATA